MKKIHEHHDDTVSHMFLDRFGQETVISTCRIKGMKESNTVQHGPGKATSSFRPSRGKVERGRAML